MATASFALREAYRLGKGVRKDSRRAFQCYRDAAVAGHAAAQYQLGLALGAGVAGKGLQAMKWLRLSAEQRHAPALLLLGVCSEKGVGIPQDKQRAFFLYSHAAELGYARAQFRLSVCYAAGTGVKQNLNKALLWFDRAASQDPARINKHGAKAIAALTRAATHLADTGSVLLEHGSRTQASAKFRKALAIRERVLGVDHPETMTLQRKLILPQEVRRPSS